MKKLTIFLLTLFLWTSCGDKKETTNKVSKTTSNISSIDQDLKMEETTKPKSPSIREYGQQIIDGKMQPSDNAETFACLDSIDDDSAETRKFFFEVYRVIAKKSDGALGEVVGSYTKSYLQTFPSEALYNFKNLDSSDKKHFIDNLAFEFYASGTDYKSDINEYITSIYNTCENCKIESVTIEKIKAELITLVSKMND